MTLDRFFAWVDKRNLVSVRSAVLFVTVWMTWRITEWSISFANAWLASGKSGVEVAAVLAAINAPFTALQVFAFKSYVESIG